MGIPETPDRGTTVHTWRAECEDCQESYNVDWGYKEKAHWDHVDRDIVEDIADIHMKAYGHRVRILFITRWAVDTTYMNQDLLDKLMGKTGDSVSDGPRE